MYEYLIVRLRQRPGQKMNESNNNRREIDTNIHAVLKDEVAEIITFDHPSTFALKLSTPFVKNTEVPEKIMNFLTTWKTVDSFCPAICTVAHDGTALTIDGIVDAFKVFASTIDYTNIDAYGLTLYPGKHIKMSIKDLSTTIRDKVSEVMDTYNVFGERSFQAKQKIEELAAKEAADALAQGLPAPTTKPKLANVPEFQMDLFKTMGFWSSLRYKGAGTSKTKEERRKALAEKTSHLPPSERVGERVILIKIGEIFLKKGNRFKFMLQLQTNIKTKLAGKANIDRVHHFYVITPVVQYETDQKTGKNVAVARSPFTDDEIREVCAIVDCVPGVENVVVAYKTPNSLESIGLTMNYMLGAAVASSYIPISKYTPCTTASIVGLDTEKKNDILNFITGTKPEDEAAVKRASDMGESIENILKLGFKIDPHTHQPCPYTSRTALLRQLGEQNRATIGSLRGYDAPIAHPGQIAYEEKLKAGEIDENDACSTWVQPQSGLEFRIEVTQDDAYIFFNTGADVSEAVGGQPTGTAGETQTVCCLLSGGMDSPVAAFSMMKRGMRVVLVHFQNANLADEDTVKHKIVQLAEQLSKYQIITILYIVPFSAIQDAIIMEVPSPARMLIYRRLMMHVTARIGRKYNASFAVLGDALGQVASQTLSNLHASYQNTPIPLLSPLIGFNKKDVIKIAQRIGTYDISALPYGDCCSYFLAKHPMTKIRPEVLQQYEASVGKSIEGGMQKLINEAYHASAIMRWHKEGREVLRELLPIKSHHDNAASKLLLQCPTRPKNDDDMDDADFAAELNKKIEEQNAMNEREAARALDDDADVMDDVDSTVDPVDEEKTSESVENTIDGTPKRITKKPRTSDDSDNKKVTISAPVTSAYLDNAATTRMFPIAIRAMLPYLTGELYGNTSSIHTLGVTANTAVEEARRIMLHVINAPTSSAKQTHRNDAVVTTQGKHVKKTKDQLLAFTSGGTESNNLAVFGTVRAAVDAKLQEIKHLFGHNVSTTSEEAKVASVLSAAPITLRVHLLTTAIEHSAMLAPMKALATNPNAIILNGDSTVGIPTPVNVRVDVSIVKTDSYGFTDLHDLKLQLQNDLNEEENVINVLTLVSVMHANNEVGAIQPLVDIGNLLQNHREALSAVTAPAYSSHVSHVPRVVYHTDACQSFGKVHLDVEECKLDLVSLNGHKVHGPKGVGALFIRPGLTVAPLTVGGGHEGNIRSGTLNVASIVGMAAAIASIYSVKTALLDSSIPPEPITTPLVYDKPPPTQTSVCVSSEAVFRTARLMEKLRDFIQTQFPRSFLNGPHVVSVSENDQKNNKEYTHTSVEEYLATLTTTPQVKLPNILSIVLDKSAWMDSSAVIKYLSARNVFVSSGSACASNAEPAPSHVLTAIGMRSDHANSTVRFSCGHLTTDDEIAFAMDALGQLAENMKTNFKPQSR